MLKMNVAIKSINNHLLLIDSFVENKNHAFAVFHFVKLKRFFHFFFPSINNQIYHRKTE